jgi:hypothetical protein
MIADSVAVSPPYGFHGGELTQMCFKMETELQWYSRCINDSVMPFHLCVYLIFL